MAGTQYRGSEIKNVDQFVNDAEGLESEREIEIGQHIGYRYDVNMVPDYNQITPFLLKYTSVSFPQTSQSLFSLSAKIDNALIFLSFSASRL